MRTRARGRAYVLLYIGDGNKRVRGLGGCIKKDQVKQYSEAKFIQAVRGTPNTVLKRERPIKQTYDSTPY